MPVRCRQLAIFYDHSERRATAEIKNAVYKIGLLQQRIVVAQDAVIELQDELAELEKKRDVNDVTVFELSNLRGQLYEAQSRLVESSSRYAYDGMRHVSKALLRGMLRW